MAFCARNAEQIAQAVGDLKWGGSSATGGVVDTADGNALKQGIAEAGDALGGPDILISSAGAMAQGVDEAAWIKNLQLDIFGAINASDAALPLLEVSAQ